jgi:hypothetical protein
MNYLPILEPADWHPKDPATKALLHCPHCNDEHLHHHHVLVFSRPREDGPVARTFVGTDGDISHIPGSWKGNPSDRRHGVAIAFSCESCGKHAELTIAQEKGNTLVGWRKAVQA